MKIELLLNDDGKDPIIESDILPTVGSVMIVDDDKYYVEHLRFFVNKNKTGFEKVRVYFKE